MTNYLAPNDDTSHDYQRAARHAQVPYTATRASLVASASHAMRATLRRRRPPKKS